MARENMTKKLLLTSCVVCSMAISLANSQQLYKWVDGQGVTHYGDALPDESVAHELFKFPQYNQASNPSDDYYSIQNQLQRLQDRRAETLKQKQQAAEIKAAKNPSRQEVYVTAVEPERRYYSSAYFPNRFNKYYKYIPGVPYHGRHYKHHNKHVSPSKTILEPAHRGLVSKPAAKRSKAVFAASK